MTARTAKTVMDLARLTSETDDDLSALEATIRQRQIVNKLMAMRAARRLSQQDIATSMGVSQSKISKLEASNDDVLSLEDMRGYLQAMNLQVQILVCPKDWSPMEQVKYFACSIRAALNRMVELARTSESVRLAEESHIETLCNLAKLIVDSANNLPRGQDAESVVPDAEMEVKDVSDYELSPT
jgi:transcriptional regulator with XRE-family HTH domain